MLNKLFYLLIIITNNCFTGNKIDIKIEPQSTDTSVKIINDRELSINSLNVNTNGLDKDCQIFNSLKDYKDPSFDPLLNNIKVDNCNPDLNYQIHMNSLVPYTTESHNSLQKKKFLLDKKQRIVNYKYSHMKQSITYIKSMVQRYKVCSKTELKVINKFQILIKSLNNIEWLDQKIIYMQWLLALNKTVKEHKYNELFNKINRFIYIYLKDIINTYKNSQQIDKNIQNIKNVMNISKIIISFDSISNYFSISFLPINLLIKFLNECIPIYKDQKKYIKMIISFTKINKKLSYIYDKKNIKQITYQIITDNLQSIIKDLQDTSLTRDSISIERFSKTPLYQLNIEFIPMNILEKENLLQLLYTALEAVRKIQIPQIERKLVNLYCNVFIKVLNEKYLHNDKLIYVNDFINLLNEFTQINLELSYLHYKNYEILIIIINEMINLCKDKNHNDYIDILSKLKNKICNIQEQFAKILKKNNNQKDESKYSFYKKQTELMIDILDEKQDKLYKIIKITKIYKESLFRINEKDISTIKQQETLLMNFNIIFRQIFLQMEDEIDFHRDKDDSDYNIFHYILHTFLKICYNILKFIYFNLNNKQKENSIYDNIKTLSQIFPTYLTNIKTCSINRKKYIECLNLLLSCIEQIKNQNIENETDQATIKLLQDQKPLIKKTLDQLNAIISKYNKNITIKGFITNMNIIIETTQYNFLEYNEPQKNHKKCKKILKNFVTVHKQHMEYFNCNNMKANLEEQEHILELIFQVISNIQIVMNIGNLKSNDNLKSYQLLTHLHTQYLLLLIKIFKKKYLFTEKHIYFIKDLDESLKIFSKIICQFIIFKKHIYLYIDLLNILINMFNEIINNINNQENLIILSKIYQNLQLFIEFLNNLKSKKNIKLKILMEKKQLNLKNQLDSIAHCSNYRIFNINSQLNNQDVSVPSTEIKSIEPVSILKKLKKNNVDDIEKQHYINPIIIASKKTSMILNETLSLKKPIPIKKLPINKPTSRTKKNSIQTFPITPTGSSVNEPLNHTHNDSSSNFPMMPMGLHQPFNSSSNFPMTPMGLHQPLNYTKDSSSNFPMIPTGLHQPLNYTKDSSSNFPMIPMGLHQPLNYIKDSSSNFPMMPMGLHQPLNYTKDSIQNFPMTTMRGLSMNQPSYTHKDSIQNFPIIPTGLINQPCINQEEDYYQNFPMDRDFSMGSINRDGP